MRKFLAKVYNDIDLFECNIYATTEEEAVETIKLNYPKGSLLSLEEIDLPKFVATIDNGIDIDNYYINAETNAQAITMAEKLAISKNGTLCCVRETNKVSPREI